MRAALTRGGQRFPAGLFSWPARHLHNRCCIKAFRVTLQVLHNLCQSIVHHNHGLEVFLTNQFPRILVSISLLSPIYPVPPVVASIRSRRPPNTRAPLHHRC